MDKLLLSIVEEFRGLTLEQRIEELAKRKDHDVALTLRHIEEISEIANLISITLEKLFLRAPVRIRDEDFELYCPAESAANDERFALAA